MAGGSLIEQAVDAGRSGSLTEALIAFLAECPKVGKTKTATVPMKAGGSYRYKYADLGDVTDTAYPILSRHGLVFTCSARLTPTGKYELVGILAHTSGQEREAALPLFGNSPQEIGSGITYGRRYLLGMMTGLVTDEDTDAAGANHEPTRGQEPPPMPPVDPIAAARGRAWGAYRYTHGAEATTTDMVAAYEQWKAQPFADATPQDFDEFARHIQQEGQQS